MYSSPGTVRVSALPTGPTRTPKEDLVLLGIVSLYVGAVFAVNGGRLVGQARGGAVSESVPESPEASRGGIRGCSQSSCCSRRGFVRPRILAPRHRSRSLDHQPRILRLSGYPTELGQSSLEDFLVPVLGGLFPRRSKRQQFAHEALDVAARRHRPDPGLRRLARARAPSRPGPSSCPARRTSTFRQRTTSGRRDTCRALSCA
jgi:hypothetical protein